MEAASRSCTTGTGTGTRHHEHHYHDHNDHHHNYDYNHQHHRLKSIRNGRAPSQSKHHWREAPLGEAPLAG